MLMIFFVKKSLSNPYFFILKLVKKYLTYMIFLINFLIKRLWSMNADMGAKKLKTYLKLVLEKGLLDKG